MLSKLGHKVMALNRIAVGPISLKGLGVGECRPLTRHEIELLQKAAAGASVPPPRFFDGGGRSTHSHGESRRPHRPENARSVRNHDNSPQRNEDGPPPRRRPKPQQQNVSHGGSKRPGHSRPPSEGQLSSGHPSPDSPKGRSRPPKLPRKRIDQANAPAKPQRTGSAPELPAEPPKIKRRIIGLKIDSPARAGAGVSVGRTRKRPPVRKRRPPGPTLSKARNSSTEVDTNDGDDA